ncbi:HIT domain-containing protein, partial [Candidatus Woesearchaeota archaeon]|nr:HIT domain-containing protein [Candidatus Woesearchaeota archaeon]
NPGHTLVVPKKHYKILMELSDNDISNLFKIVKDLSKAVLESTGAEGIEIRQRNGAIAGQVVPHVHVHIIPRFKDDNVPADWTPKQLKEEQFVEMQKRISEAIKKVAPTETKEPKKKGKLPKVPPKLP